MNKLRHSWYYLMNEKTENRFEKIFKEIEKQLEIYSRQFNLTLTSYKKEWNSELELTNVNFKELEIEANKVYDEILEKNRRSEDAHNYAMHVSGLAYLHEENFNKNEEINYEYSIFLDLYCKSILVALYSLNESKLNTICTLASEVFNKRIKPNHFNNRDFLNSSIQYLDYVIEIDVDKLQSFHSSLKDIQFLRNNIVHTVSIFKDVKTAQQIVKKNSSTLSFDSEKMFLKITGSKFILDLFQILRNFYEELFWLIDLKQNNEIVHSSIVHWLGVIDKEIKVDSLKYERVSVIERKLDFKVFSENKDVQDFRCKINLRSSKVDTFELTLQREEAIIVDFFEFEKKINGKYLRDIFKNLSLGKPVQIKIIVY